MSHELLIALNAALNRSVSVTHGIPFSEIEDLGSMLLDEDDDLIWDVPTGVYVRAVAA